MDLKKHNLYMNIWNCKTRSGSKFMCL